jgi:hypothetical protein
MEAIMKNRLLIIALIIALAGCTPGVDPRPTHGAPDGISVSGTKGIYLEADSGITATKSLTLARDVVTSGDATLGTVTATGVPQPAVFTDAEGVAVDVTVTKAIQLTDDYVLLSYSYILDGESIPETATLDLDTGTLAIVTIVPADWGRIFARGEKAWYVSGGSIYKMDLATGTATEISKRASAYSNSGSGGDLTDLDSTRLWDSATWLFADLSETIYAFTGGYQDFRAQAISAGGTKKEFGFQAEAYQLYEWQPANSISGGCHALYDDATGSLYVIKGRPIWDNDPSKVGGMEQTGGYTLHLYKETLNASLARPLVLSTTPVAYAPLTGSSTAQTMYIGRKYRTDESYLTFGGYTFRVNDDSISSYDTGGVPVSHELPDGSTQPYYVSNWTYAGGQVYAGPTDSTDTINLVQMSSGAAAVKMLVADSGITSWTVVAGLLFYTNASGTFRAAVDTNTGTLGTVETYSGGQVVAVTQ